MLQDIEGPAPPGHELLSLEEGTLRGGKQTLSFDTTNFIQVLAGEGDDGMFTILQPSYEDAQGVLKMQTIKTGIGLLSNQTFNALMMLDFWNPVYSWHRGVLMQYVPGGITFDSETKTYDCEIQLIENVKASSHYVNGDKESPEYRFISLLGVSLEDMQAKIKTYFKSVAARLQTFDGMVEYLTLAESRRRIYRPVPLNEFALTLPYALNYEHPPTSRFEMTETGQVIPMATRGLQFFHRLTSSQVHGSLAGFDPRIIPAPDDNSAESIGVTTLNQGERISLPQKKDVGRQKPWGCPYRRAYAAKLDGH